MRSVLVRVWVLLLLTPLVRAEGADPWWDEDWEAAVHRVNEGVLQFLAEEPAGAHRHENRVVVSAQSLASGWALLDQCHRHLDAIDRVEVVYHPERIRDLEVKRAEGIAEAWVEEHTVQLRGVGKGAELCIQGESRMLTSLSNGRYQLNNGPFMRRFLDGYYPLTVVMRVELPGPAWELISVEPEPQPGFRVERTADGYELEAWFEGRLETRLVFRSGSINGQPN